MPAGGQPGLGHPFRTEVPGPYPRHDTSGTAIYAIYAAPLTPKTTTSMYRQSYGSPKRVVTGILIFRMEPCRKRESNVRRIPLKLMDPHNRGVPPCSIHKGPAQGS